MKNGLLQSGLSYAVSATCEALQFLTDSMLIAITGAMSPKSDAQKRGDVLIGAGLGPSVARPANLDQVAHTGGFALRVCEKHGRVSVVHADDPCPECVLDAYLSAPPGAVEGGPLDDTPAPGAFTAVEAPDLFPPRRRRRRK